MADTQGIVAGSAEAQELHPSYWHWLMSGGRADGMSPNGNGSANGHASPNGNALANGHDAFLNGNGSANGNGLTHANGSLNGNGLPHGNGRLKKDVTLGAMTPTGLARRLGRR